VVSVKQQVDEILNQYLAQGKFVGPAGPSGPQGESGAASVADDDYGNSNVIVGGNPIVAYMPGEGDSVASFGELSGVDLMSTTLTVTGPSYLADVNASGAGNFGGPLSVGQSVSITGNSSGAAASSGTPAGIVTTKCSSTTMLSE